MALNNLNPHPLESEFLDGPERNGQEPGPASPPALSPSSPAYAPGILSSTAQELNFLKDTMARTLQLVQQNISLGDQRNEKLAKLQETVLTQASELFSEMRDTMELMQATIAAVDQQVQRLGAVTAALVTLDSNFRDMVAQWQLEHQR